MDTLVYDKKKNSLVKKIRQADIPSYIKNPDYLLWLDIENPSKTNMQFLLDHFHFHPLDIEDCLSVIERPKLDEYDDYFFLVLHIPLFIKQTRRLVPFTVNIFIGNNFIVTVHQGPCKPIENTYDNISQDPGILSKGSGYLLHRVLLRRHWCMGRPRKSLIWTLPTPTISTPGKYSIISIKGF